MAGMDPFLVKTVNDAGISIFQTVRRLPITSGVPFLPLNLLQVSANSGEAGNCLISPVALNYALATACAAAENTTRDQLREVLRHKLLGGNLDDPRMTSFLCPSGAPISTLPLTQVPPPQVPITTIARFTRCTSHSLPQCGTFRARSNPLHSLTLAPPHPALTIHPPACFRVFRPCLPDRPRYA